MIAAALLWACLAAPSGPEPVAGDCATDPGALVAEAEALLSGTGAEPDAETLASARRLLRSARRIDGSAALALRAADLAFAAGDAEEGGDLLAAAADRGPGRLSPAELLLLGRRAEQRRRWREAISRYRDLARSLAARGETAGWIAPRIAELELEDQAGSIVLPSSGPSAEARLALADGKRALADGRLRQAREHLQAALQLAPEYVEALLALSALETRSGRPGPAIRASRSALAIEPDRVETLTLLANLLWNEPDRRAREESLALLDRAVALRPDARALLRLCAGRWAEYGDPSKARERLDRYLARATAPERAEAAPLREALARGARAAPDAAPTPEPVPEEEPASAAADRWRKAQVLAARGDEVSLVAALALLAEAEQLDPALSRAPELAAAIHERRSEWRPAEDALRRAIRADPSRATTRESLARLIERDAARAAEAGRAWASAEQAGSTEALFHLAQSAERSGRGADASRLYRRYRDEAPAGLHAAETASAVRRLDRQRVLWLLAAAAAAVLLLGAAAIAMYRRRSGDTFGEWLVAHPGRAPEARRIVGRLQHEALKHGGMLLSDAARRLEKGDEAARRAAAGLLVVRIHGAPGSRGLVADTESAVADLRALARADGRRLNLARRDPVLSPLLRGVRALRRNRATLRRLAGPGRAPIRLRRAVRLLRHAAKCFQLASGSELQRTLDAASALPVRSDDLRALLSRVASEMGAAEPALETAGPLATGDHLPAVRIAPSDWATIWRNLFANAIAAGRLSICAAALRDPITGEGRLRIVLSDDLPGTLTTDEIRRRPVDRGLGVVVDVLRRNDGSIGVVAASTAGFTKGIVIELPAVEEPA